jgi:hypothetical protein
MTHSRVSLSFDMSLALTCPWFWVHVDRWISSDGNLCILMFWMIPCIGMFTIRNELLRDASAQGECNSHKHATTLGVIRHREGVIVNILYSLLTHVMLGISAWHRASPSMLMSMRAICSFWRMARWPFWISASWAQSLRRFVAFSCHYQFLSWPLVLKPSVTCIQLHQD